MKQFIRFFINPKAFVNQLQWSSNHWFILITFLSLVSLETQVGKNQHLYQMAALVLEQKYHLGLSISLWLVMAAKLSFSLVAAFAFILLMDFIGSSLGRKNSKRVLSRRIAVIFAVFVFGLIGKHFSSVNPWVELAAYALMGWSIVLGFFAIREHFHLKNLETAILSLFLLLLIKTSWTFSKVAFEVYLKKEVTSFSKKTSARLTPRF